MTCPQCSAELPDTATFCYKCGSATRPAAFSYLPAGTPPWPTTLAERPLYRAGTFAQNAQEGETLPSAKKVDPKPRRSASSIVVMVLIFLLTPLLAVGATLGTLWINGQFPVSTTHA